MLDQLKGTLSGVYDILVGPTEKVLTFFALGIEIQLPPQHYLIRPAMHLVLPILEESINNSAFKGPVDTLRKYIKNPFSLYD